MEPRTETSARAEFFQGARLLARGIALYARTPRFLLLGLIPAVISFALLAVAWVALVNNLGDLSALVTWFADDWGSTARSLARFGAGAGILALSALLSVLTYTALTLLVGDPFYEHMSQQIEQRLGGTPGETDLPWYRTIHKNALDSVRLLLLGLLLAIPLFLLGFVPVVGQTVVPVLNAVVGGWLLSVELTGIPFNRRGERLRDRRLALRANRPLALGFGIPVFLILLIPFVSIFVIPGAVAGGTLLTRRLKGLPVEAGAAARTEKAVA